MTFLCLLRAVQISKGLIFDILSGQEGTPLQFLHMKGLSIDNLSDTAALKMTHVNWCQLRCLYAAFDLKGLLKLMQEKLSFLTQKSLMALPAATKSTLRRFSSLACVGWPWVCRRSTSWTLTSVATDLLDMCVPMDVEVP
jgi:hypothetical protein